MRITIQPAYDLYLIFNECIKDERFVEIISMDSYDGTLTGADGTVRKQTWTPTQAYGAGEATEPGRDPGTRRQDGDDSTGRELCDSVR